MQRLKRRKYYLEVNVLDTLNFSIPISEKAYRHLKKDLKKQVAETQADPDMEETFVAEDSETKEQYTQTTSYTYKAELGTTDIYLVKAECNPGYHFREK